jgi:hypothetical protein
MHIYVLSHEPYVSFLAVRGMDLQSTETYLYLLSERENPGELKCKLSPPIVLHASLPSEIGITEVETSDKFLVLSSRYGENKLRISSRSKGQHTDFSIDCRYDSDVNVIIGQINESLRNQSTYKENAMGKFEYLRRVNRIRLSYFKTYVHHHDDAITFGSNIARVLGFVVGKEYACQEEHLAENAPDFQSTFKLTCNISAPVYIDGKISPSLRLISPSEFGKKVRFNPVYYRPLAVKVIEDLYIRIVDQDERMILFPPNSFSRIALHLRIAAF